jgi:hypothetical protein
MLPGRPIELASVNPSLLIDPANPTLITAHEGIRNHTSVREVQVDVPGHSRRNRSHISNRRLVVTRMLIPPPDGPILVEEPRDHVTTECGTGL